MISLSLSLSSFRHPPHAHYSSSTQYYTVHRTTAVRIKVLPGFTLLPHSNFSRHSTDPSSQQLLPAGQRTASALYRSTVQSYAVVGGDTKTCERNKLVIYSYSYCLLFYVLHIYIYNYIGHVRHVAIFASRRIRDERHRLVHSRSRREFGKNGIGLSIAFWSDRKMYVSSTDVHIGIWRGENVYLERIYLFPGVHIPFVALLLSSLAVAHSNRRPYLTFLPLSLHVVYARKYPCFSFLTNSHTHTRTYMYAQ